MGIFTQPSDVIDLIPGCLTCPELRTGYIHSIGTAVDCRDADICVSCRSKQFKFSHNDYLLRASNCCFAAAPSLGSERTCW